MAAAHGFRASLIAIRKSFNLTIVDFDPCEFVTMCLLDFACANWYYAHANMRYVGCGEVLEWPNRAAC